MAGPRRRRAGRRGAGPPRGRRGKNCGTVERNVLVQLDSLLKHPVVAAGLAAGTLRLHAWVLRFESAKSSPTTRCTATFSPLLELPFYLLCRLTARITPNLHPHPDLRPAARCRPRPAWVGGGPAARPTGIACGVLVALPLVSGHRQGRRDAARGRDHHRDRRRLPRRADRRQPAPGERPRRRVGRDPARRGAEVRAGAAGRRRPAGRADPGGGRASCGWASGSGCVPGCSSSGMLAGIGVVLFAQQFHVLDDLLDEARSPTCSPSLPRSAGSSTTTATPATRPPPSSASSCSPPSCSGCSPPGGG